MSDKPIPSSVIVNVPNTLTGIRFLLSIVAFVLLPLHFIWAALAIFIIAVSTDWIDGYWARKYNQVTQFGRIFDPFVDKIIICGTFVFLVALPGSGIAAWVAVVVMGREMLVTVIRSFVEQHGGDFSANWPGKWKMVFQCASAILSMIVLGMDEGTAQTTWYGLANVSPAWLVYLFNLVLWGTITLTLASGWIYIVDAIRMIQSGKLSSK
ncbi:CDP-diacylglycerol--glycerol-3-phosphate 3-phosphatidyltransferase [Bremerella sp. T1]|uniref:CDP-diacylglycerol--glycerol-3-phosphate 3-phosphatidyltransferase n=1 Tax=Bremerella sp. TYQ1 TaxID=3119568 RepID=UPI001CCB969A|nr:CDP-diacylglycerol--glycerol-3-phosphate 3-phosphatidyltransferase [Bremerella volcania]UBM37323.1 CDP-diacylglycerol--glycerol-3-phosphate 3-phosphatidyltransferase [Bremerella volcania]